MYQTIKPTPITYKGSELKLTSVQPSIYGTYRAIGFIYNDSRFEDGQTIVTSPVEFIDFTKGTLKTRNTLYNLI